MVLVFVFALSITKGSLSGLLITAATSFAIPMCDKQSDLLGVISISKITSDFFCSIDSTSCPAIVSRWLSFSGRIFVFTYSLSHSYDIFTQLFLSTLYALLGRAGFTQLFLSYCPSYIIGRAGFIIKTVLKILSHFRRINVYHLLHI